MAMLSMPMSRKSPLTSPRNPQLFSVWKEVVMLWEGRELPSTPVDRTLPTKKANRVVDLALVYLQG